MTGEGTQESGFAPRPGRCPLLSSAAVARLYDLMLMLDPNAPEERQNEVLSNVQSMIESGGTLAGRHDWGVRRMAFEIDHRPEGAYHLFQFETDANDLLERLDHSLKIADGVLRFRIIRLKPGSPAPPVPRQEPARSRERPQETRVAARAAADADRPADSEGSADADRPADADSPAHADRPADADSPAGDAEQAPA
jgi:small subunit ribosomal protein S6